MSSSSKWLRSWPALPAWARPLAVLLVSGLLYAVSPFGTFVRDVPVEQVRWLLAARADWRDREAMRLRSLGNDYRVVEFIRERATEEEVILLSDPDLPSALERLKAKNVRWCTYFLYPRRLLYVYETDSPLYRDAKWVLLDSPEAAAWLPPELRPDLSGSAVHVISLDMSAYLDALDSGELSIRYRPPDRSLRSMGGGR